MENLEVTVEHLFDDDEFILDNVQVRCYPQGGKIERMKCGLHDELEDNQLREFDGLFRTASAVGDGLIMTKGDDMTIIGGSQISKDGVGKCAKLEYPDGENQLLCKFWRVGNVEGK